ncbi:MAG: hypothetical protein ABSH35_32495 [Isosphaeraceae bacterium]
MPEDHLRFRCYRCNQLLGVSSRKAGTVISCPRCAAELKVPRPEEQTVTADASRSGHGFTTESRVPVSSTTPTSKSGGNALPAFMEEIAAAIPDDLATLRPEDIRVEAEFVDLVVTTSEGVTPPAARVPQSEPLPGDPVEVEAYFAQTPPPAEPPPVVRAEPPPVVRAELPPVVPAEPRSVDPPVDLAIGAVLPAIKIETPSLLPPGRQLQAVSEVILQPATVLAWSLLVLLALPMAFLAGLLLGHFVWK